MDAFTLNFYAMLTFDTNRLGKVTQRKFNACWRELEGEPVYLLPKIAGELTGNRINPYSIELGIEATEKALHAQANTLTPKQRRWGQSILWWANAFLDTGSLYQVRLLSAREQEKAEAICDALDRSAFPDLKMGIDTADHADAVIVSEALATNTKILITSDANMDHAKIHQWAAQNATTFDIEEPYFLFEQDAFLHENYATETGLLFLYHIVLGASWPLHGAPAHQDILDEIQRTLTVMAQRESGFNRVGHRLAQAWHKDPRKDDMIEYVRDHLPEKMRCSERQHPALNAIEKGIT